MNKIIFLLIQIGVFSGVFGQRAGDTLYVNEFMEKVTMTDAIAYRILPSMENSGEAIRYFYLTGELFCEQVPANRANNDTRKRFYQNGDLETEGLFRNNLPVGEHHYYSIGGTYIRTDIYNKRGELIAEYIKTNDGRKVYTISNRQSSFGGYRNESKALREMGEFIDKELVSPKVSEEFAEPSATANFLISPTGVIEDIQIVQSVHPDLDSALINVLKKMPKWRPAKYKGKRVYSEFSITVSF